MFYVERFIILCPYLRVSTIGGYTVHVSLMHTYYTCTCHTHTHIGHGFTHKWLLLTDPDDPSAGPKGYLKFSINVIGPGDDPTPSPSTMSQESVDIES